MDEHDVRVLPNLLAIMGIGLVTSASMLGRRRSRSDGRPALVLLVVMVLLGVVLAAVGFAQLDRALLAGLVTLAVGLALFLRRQWYLRNAERLLRTREDIWRDDHKILRSKIERQRQGHPLDYLLPVVLGVVLLLAWLVS